MMTTLLWLQLAMIPIPGLGSEQAQLMMLVRQSQQQLLELRRILHSADSSHQSLERANEILEQMTQGIDHAVEPYRGSREYNLAALEIQRERSARESASRSPRVFDSLPPEELEALERHREELMKFHSQIETANQMDFEDLFRIENKLSEAQGGELGRLQALTGAKSWESSLRLSTQLNALLHELRKIRESLEDRELQERQHEAKMKQQIQRALQGPLGRHD